MRNVQPLLIVSRTKLYLMYSLSHSEISSFNAKINGLVEVLELHAKRIDDQKLKVETS
jgi:hypothetical protein